MISEVVINRPDISVFNRRIREKHTDDFGDVHVISRNHTFATDPATYTINDVLDDVAYQVALTAEYAPVLAQNATNIENIITQNDADIAGESDGEVSANDYATIEHVALAYLKKAYSLQDPYEAYLKFNKFNNYRVSKGWSTSQVVAGLASVGLTQEEWDLMLARYTYLSFAQRVTAMQDYQTVKAGDIWSNN